MLEQYDKIAEQYKKSRENIVRQHIVIPTFFEFLGNIKDEKVLDLACGFGFFTRCIKEKGASEVVGVDISQEMIRLARQKEDERPLGIKYLNYDVATLPKIGEFDLVTAVFLLHYAKTKKDLFAMCKNIYNNLKEGGRFITINSDPLSSLQSDEKYGYTVTAKEPLKEGGTLTVKIFINGVEKCSFEEYFWKKETYEDALKSAGFKTIEWHKIIVSQEGIEKFEKDFWKKCQDGLALIECEK